MPTINLMHYITTRARPEKPFICCLNGLFTIILQTNVLTTIKDKPNLKCSYI